MSDKRTYEEIAAESSDEDEEYDLMIKRQKLLEEILWYEEGNKNLEDIEELAQGVRPFIGINSWKGEGLEQFFEEEADWAEKDEDLIGWKFEERAEEYANEYAGMKRKRMIEEASIEELERELKKLKEHRDAIMDENEVVRKRNWLKMKEMERLEKERLAQQGIDLAERAKQWRVNFLNFQKIEVPFYKNALNALKIGISKGSMALQPWKWTINSTLRWLGFLKWENRLRFWGCLIGTYERYNKRKINEEDKKRIMDWWKEVYVKSGVDVDTIPSLRNFLYNWPKGRGGKFKYDDLITGKDDIVN